MSKAWKCDRCGKLFEGDGNKESSYVSINTVWVFDGAPYNADSLSSDIHVKERYGQFELCKECSAEFISFIKPKKKEEKKDEPKCSTIDSAITGISDIRDALREFVQSLDSRGLGCIRKYIDSICDGKTSERESGTEQKIDN